MHSFHCIHAAQAFMISLLLIGALVLFSLKKGPCQGSRSTQCKTYHVAWIKTTNKVVEGKSLVNYRQDL